MNKKAKTRQLYEKPSVSKLSPEEARLKLADYVEKRHEGANELLSLLDKHSNKKKKSA